MVTTKSHGLSKEELDAEIARLSLVESEQFRDYLLKLPEKKWNNISFCTEWTIRTVVEHNVVEGLSFIEGLQAIKSGKGELPFFDHKEADQLEHEIAGMSLTKMAHRLAEDTYEMFDLLQKLTPEQRATPWKTRFGTFKADNYVNMRLIEISIHSWDVRVVEDLTARLNRDSVRVMLPGAINFMAGMADRQALAAQPNLTYQFELTGAVPGPVTFKVEDGKPLAKPDLEGDPVAYLKMDSDAFLRLVWGRLRLEWMVKNGWVKVEGDTDAALKLPQIFKGLY
jgi:uncharacterized protein (TIGR03083 family)